MPGLKDTYAFFAHVDKETRYPTNTFIWSQVNQAAPPAPSPNEVVEKTTYVLVSMQVAKEALGIQPDVKPNTTK